MEIDKEFENLIESCGGEDLLRYLMKDDGVEDWETVKLNPIVAYSPNHMDKAFICGIAYWNQYNYNIIHSDELDDYKPLQNWVFNMMEKHSYQWEAEVLLNHSKAIIVTDIEMKESKRKSWEKIVLEVIYGFRSTNYMTINSTEQFYNNSTIDSLTSFFDILMDIKKDNNINIIQKSYTKKPPLDFSQKFKDEWC